MANGDDKTTSKSVTIEEIMFTIISATQEVFKEYMDVQLLAGLVVKQIQAINMDLIAIVGISGPRVGYIMIGSDMRSASRITMKLLSEDSVDEPSIRDAFGELANNIAGAFRTKYHEQYGRVAMGLPLVASGMIQPIGAPAEKKAKKTSTLKIQQQGVVIPFQSADNSLRLKVMFYM